MKYVWASWGNKIDRQLPAAENTNGVRTKHIRGYGCAVTFSSTHIRWSLPAATYSLKHKFFAISFDQR
ncbi:MAG: hypothetical protein WEB30_02505 [Cyclobacteriaceae bacterium]